MNPLAKKKERTLAREYLRKRPDCTYEELIKDLGITSLSKPYFFNLRGILRRSGAIPVGNGSKRGRKKEDGTGLEKSKTENPAMTSTTVEILHAMDASKVTPELREHWKTTVLPVLKSLVPGGAGISLVFLTDPPTLEIRRVVG